MVRIIKPITYSLRFLMGFCSILNSTSSSSQNFFFLPFQKIIVLFQKNICGIFLIELVCFFCHRNLKSPFMCHPHDLDALRDFIANREQKLGGWIFLFSTDCCNFDRNHLHLASINHDNTTKLELVNKKLSGKLSESVKKLDEIRVLNRSQNFIKDSIPISIFNLVNRQTLDLSSNDLSDEIPRSIILLA